MTTITKTLILYSTVDGQTKKICNYIAQSLSIEPSNTTSASPDNLLKDNKSVAHNSTDANNNTVVDTLLLEDFINTSNKKLADYDNIIIGASIRYGKHRKNLIDFINHNKTLLTTKNTAFFSVNLVARKAEKNTQETNPYVATFLAEVAWQPTLVDVFAGTLDYALYGLIDTLMMKFIMWITKGPTHSDVPIEFTDWQRVDSFVESFYQNFCK